MALATFICPDHGKPYKCVKNGQILTCKDCNDLCPDYELPEIIYKQCDHCKGDEDGKSTTVG